MGFFALIILVFSALFSTQIIAKAIKHEELKPYNSYYQQLAPEKEYRATALEVVARLGVGHYKEITLNDRFSRQIFEKIFEDLDPMRMFFIQSDIDALQKHSDKIDDHLRKGDTGIFFDIYNLYASKAVKRYIKVIHEMDQGLKFDFNKKEFVQIDRAEEPWAKSEAQLDDLWRKRLKNGWLSLKLAGKDDDKIYSLLRKRYMNSLNQVSQVNKGDVFEMSINSYASLFDPHTQYFSPINSENFNIRMKLSLEGIGALLKKEDEYTKIVRLIPAGPADKSKLLKAGDKVIGVAQDDDEMVDIIGWRLDDVVNLIRGEKGTTVRLNVISGNTEDLGSAKIISITRDTVKLEDKAAKKKIIEVTQGGRKLKVGVIDLPTFYVDFKAYYAGDPDYKSTTRDVKRLVNELKQEGIDGLVIDLRDNGGGSLTEAYTLAGLFIKSGPVVQVKDARSEVTKYGDYDGQITYEGPLTVLVNRLSASASEIFAGAIQDYRRGLVVGVQTFGKGTVQHLTQLGRGQLKYTQAKFYRISGESTQNQGVVPDISFPALYDTSEIGESSLKHAMPWDSIQPVRYSMFNGFERFIPELIQRHNTRMKSNPELIFLTDQLDLVKQAREKQQLSINESIRDKERAELKKNRLEIENKKRKSLGQELLTKLEDDDVEEEDQEKDPLLEDETNKLDEDPLLDEATKVMADLIELTDIANAKVAQRVTK
ncbi:MAG: tail-specific protease [Gammaproteobacteria bacterium]|nr:MAG: tail-specific protease [Gammaproteobacteria bacterium]